ncbi:putative EGF-like domain-containing protein [Helianthus annuus]|nr:putative EGF-like domain-containing protein [Helianthus annuus]
MADYSILGFLYSNQFYLFIIYFTTFLVSCCSHEDGYGSFTISSFTYTKTFIRPYDWRYIGVDLPTSFSSMTIALESDVHLDKDHVQQADIYNLPMICVREGSPPLPDAYNASITGLVLDPISNESLGTQSLQFAEKCYPMQKYILLRLTNEQISPGVWYFGLFNGIESTTTQSKMISGYSFSGNVSVEGCMGPSKSGQFCNQTIDQLSCVDQSSTQESFASCRNNYESSCSGPNEPKVYTFDLFGVSEKITISTSKVKVNQNQLSDGTTSNQTRIGLMCYVRHGAMPSSSIHDYSGNIVDTPLAIQSPKVGRWYITIVPMDLSNGTMGNVKVCYSLTWQMRQCPQNKAGVNCTWERYMLQTILRKNAALPFESYYIPVSDNGSSRSSNFLLEPLLSYNSLDQRQSQSQSQSQSQDFAWTYFIVDIPLGAAGGSIHVRINSDTKLNYEIYVSYGGLPLEDKWDYFYANSTSNSNGSMFFKLYDSDEKNIGFYIVYASGGTWGFGIKHLTSSHQSQSQTTMAISVERCPRRCSSHGTCQNVVEMSGLSLYSFCNCDRTHGGFDCSVELVSHRGLMLQSVSLIASNAAFVFPAYWALRQKAFAEWVLYTSSGISSGLYHACDVGIWCALSLHVLQFMDFWLSFMAVVSTFVYLATIGETSKRAIHMVAAILTALMAETRTTRSSNVVLVIAIGATGLFAGWLIEFFTHDRRFSFSAELFLNLLHRWQTFKGWFRNLVKTLVRRFQWFFVLAGFVALSMAAISWSLESTESYWFWHSVWHVSIYMGSFFFLCSKVNAIECENQGSTSRDYQLTRQDSLSRCEDPQANA